MYINSFIPNDALGKNGLAYRVFAFKEFPRFLQLQS